MVDPLGITASIIAVLQLTGTVVGYLKDVKDGSGDRKRILSEVVTIEAFLSILKQRAESPDHRDEWLQTLTSLNTPKGPIEQFKLTLECLNSKLQPTGAPKKTLQVLAWPFHKQEVNDILWMLDRQTSLFKLALQNDHM